MQKESKQQWHSQTFANRVSISRNPGRLKIVVKAEAFFLSNNILTLALSSVFISDIMLAYLFGIGLITFGVVTISTTIASVLLSFGLARAWFWHNLGEENIEINGKEFSVSRNYTFYKTNKKIIQLGDSTELFTNKLDTWSWNKMQSKGTLRVSDDENSVDFGIKLSDEEYEMLVIPIGIEIKKHSGEKAKVTEAVETDSSQQNIEKDADKPNIEEQQQGQHKKVLDDYHKKVAGTSENILDEMDPVAKPGPAEKKEDEKV